MFDHEWDTLRTVIVGVSISAMIIAGVFAWARFRSPETEPEFKEFPFEGAKAVYSVESNSSLGFLIGKLSREVTNVSENTYSIRQEVEGNLSKAFENNKIEQLKIDEALIWSPILEKATLIGENEISAGGRTLTIFHYYFENKKAEKVTNIWISKKKMVPIIVSYDFPSGYLYMTLENTNVGYLVV